MSRKQETYYLDDEHTNFGSRFSQIKLVSYWVLAGLRIFLTLVPQYGYIHPDEYFQSIEVIAGDIFDVETSRPWEFNTTFPIRSIAIPYLTIGLPFGILKSISPFVSLWLNINIKTPYALLMLPRLVYSLLSFMCDYSLYKICYAYGQNYRSRLLMFASSYVVLVYGTRTFSNTTEMIMMSILLYLVADCMKLTDMVIYQDEYLADKYKAADNPVERVKLYKLRNALPNHSLSRCVAIASITVAGIFNRPTFIAFAFPPVFFWLHRGLGSKTVGLAHFHLRIITFILSGLPMAFLLIVIDSFYYGYLTMHEMHVFKVNLDNFVVAPLNFLKYNSNAGNLAKHGLHPRFLHFVVNLPLLYNVLALVGLLAFLSTIYRGINGKRSELPRIQSIWGLMTASFIIPVAALSIFPHQEPRFLIPVTLPLVFVHAQRIRVAYNERQSKHGNVATFFGEKQRNYLLSVWYICNIAFTLFYGFLHQGGVYPLATHFSNEIRTKPRLTAIHLVTCYTYSLPLSLLQLKNTRRPHINKRTGQRYRLAKEFYSYEMGSASLDDVKLKLESLFQSCEEKRLAKKLGYRLYLAIPGSLTNDFIELTRNAHNYSTSVSQVFYPHITTEALPNFNRHKKCSNEDKFFELCEEESFFASSLSYLYNFVEQSGLSLVQLQKLSQELKVQ